LTVYEFRESIISFWISLNPNPFKNKKWSMYIFFFELRLRKQLMVLIFQQQQKMIEMLIESLSKGNKVGPRPWPIF
jgi:hypothetical protein